MATLTGDSSDSTRRRRLWLATRLWEWVVVATATFAALEIPRKIVFPALWEGRSPIPELIISIVFTIDIFFRLRRHRAQRARDDEGSSHRIWLVLDVLAALPFGLIFASLPLRLFDLIKFARVVQFIQEWRRRDHRRAALLRIVGFVYGLAISAHWIACGWIAMHPDMSSSTDPRNSYIDALYWTVTTLATVGYGDVVPKTPEQKLFAMGVMIIGVAVYGFIIGNIAGILARIDPAKVAHEEHLERVNAFMRYRKIPPDLQHRVLDYHNYLWAKGFGHDEASILSELPPGLRIDVSMFLRRDIIERVTLFHGAGEAFIRDIALQLRPVVFTPGDYVFHAGDTGHDMYFISRGEVEVVTADDKTVLATLDDGDFFGEMALFYSQPRTASIRATTYCDLYRLDKDVFDRVLHQYPEISEELRRRAHERIQRNESKAGDESNS